MFGSDGKFPHRALVGLFALMLPLAGAAFLTGSDVITRLLGALVPLAGVVFAVVSLRDAESELASIPAAVLGVGCSVGVYLEIVGAGAFSNPVVDVAIVASVSFLTVTNGNDGPVPTRSPPREPTGKRGFRERLRSILPDSESVLIAALVLCSAGVLLDVMGIEVIANLRESVRSNPLRLLLPFGLYAASKVVEVLRRRSVELLLNGE